MQLVAIEIGFCYARDSAVAGPKIICSGLVFGNDIAALMKLTFRIVHASMELSGGKSRIVYGNKKFIAESVKW